MIMVTIDKTFKKERETIVIFRVFISLFKINFISFIWWVLGEKIKIIITVNLRLGEVC